MVTRLVLIHDLKMVYLDQGQRKIHPLTLMCEFEGHNSCCGAKPPFGVKILTDFSHY